MNDMTVGDGALASILRRLIPASRESVKDLLRSVMRNHRRKEWHRSKLENRPILKHFVESVTAYVVDS